MSPRAPSAESPNVLIMKSWLLLSLGSEVPCIVLLFPDGPC